MKDRSAVSTILGYLYQFDYSIIRLLQLNGSDDSIVVEGLEDVDVNELGEVTAIQCKYYSNTEYNHSEIAEAIRFMLQDYSDRVCSGKRIISYMLYGFYNSGQDKLPKKITLEFLKTHFLTFRHEKKIIEFHKSIGVSDYLLVNFLEKLKINVNAFDYSEQQKQIMQELMRCFSCSEFEATHYYYNNAIRIINDYSIKTNYSERMITKQQFLNSIDNKEMLFNKWLHLYKGEHEYYRKIKREFFTDFNLQPIERLFLVEFDNAKCSLAELKEVIYIIEKKYTKISRRMPNPFCPYIYIHNISAQSLIELKRELENDSFHFIDGYPFYGSSFSSKFITLQANFNNGIRVKIINSLDNLTSTFEAINRRKTIYQFYLNTPFYLMDNSATTHIKIQINCINAIKEII